MSLFAFLIALAVPMYADFLGNSQVRNAAEAMLNGVLSAQTAAISANTQVQLVVTPATGWTIAEVNPDLSVRHADSAGAVSTGERRAQCGHPCHAARRDRNHL